MNSVIDWSAINIPKHAELVLAPLEKESIREHLKAQGMENIKDIHVFSSISSTNDYLLEHDTENNQVSVCVSEHQTQGRGRYGHQWTSPAEANLYLSMTLPISRPNNSEDSNQLEALSLWLLVAMAKLLEREGCEGVQLKWPNDICVENKKLAGVLIERKVGSVKNKMVIGVGVNVAMSLIKEIDLETPWIDLLTTKPDWWLTRNELAAKIVVAFYEVMLKLEHKQLASLGSVWGRYDMLLNKNVKFLHNGESKTGFVKGVDDFGRIVMVAEEEPEHMHASHISEIKLIGKTE